MKQERVKAVIRGAVQGVGFRPFVYRLAKELGLNGWVLNSSQGVFIEVEGERLALDQFVLRIERDKPPRAIIHSFEFLFLDPVGFAGFEIRESADNAPKTALILPDIATCADCQREIFDPLNRRHLYPFTNCTNCGPRFTIIESLPYDRPNTSMKKFFMCRDCEREYLDPIDRRFHAQPNACPQCGPQLELWNSEGRVLAQRTEALSQAAKAVRAGQILALKGIGGFQLIVDACNDEAVCQLRARKCREEKPFGLMYPTLTAIKEDCHVGGFEERLLTSPEAPIVLLQRKVGVRKLAASLAPRNPYLGVMLPYSPLHHIFMRELAFTVVATSANLSDEPICIDEHEALQRLHGIADVFLVHNRPIVRHVDDSVVRMIQGREMMLRRGRGYAPLPIHLPHELPPVLAVGAHLKNTVALSVGNDILISQHIGDLESPQALDAFQRVIADFQQLYEVTPEFVACDLHPEYLSTKHAKGLNASIMPIQHHYAHVLACMIENELEPPVLGVAWDGTGYGLDGTIWGGEFLLLEASADMEPGHPPFNRFAHFRTFSLPGGQAAIKQPCRPALGLLWEIFGEKLFTDHRDLPPFRNFSSAEIGLLKKMLARGVNAPKTSSAGRLFDAIAAVLGMCQCASFEGQAAMELEFAIEAADEDVYSFDIETGAPLVVDWEPMIMEILADLQRCRSVGLIAAKFHNALAEIIVTIARRTDVPKVVLSGGCFQNKYLTERTAQRLWEEGFHPYSHQRIPPNDGGIALGQVMGVARTHRQKPQFEEAFLA